MVATTSTNKSQWPEHYLEKVYQLPFEIQQKILEVIVS